MSCWALRTLRTVRADRCGLVHNKRPVGTGGARWHSRSIGKVADFTGNARQRVNCVLEKTDVTRRCVRVVAPVPTRTVRAARRSRLVGIPTNNQQTHVYTHMSPRHP